MTSPFNPPITTDPRSKGKMLRGSTPISVSSTREDEGIHAIAELTERIETLVNHTGQLQVEIQDRPVKYNVQIRDLGDDHYELTEPMLALIEEYPGDSTLIASFPEVEAFGEGATESEAVLNLKHAILDLYEELVATPPEELGDLPRGWLRILHRVIREAASA